MSKLAIPPLGLDWALHTTLLEGVLSPQWLRPSSGVWGSWVQVLAPHRAEWKFEPRSPMSLMSAQTSGYRVERGSLGRAERPSSSPGQTDLTSH